MRTKTRRQLAWLLLAMAAVWLSLAAFIKRAESQEKLWARPTITEINAVAGERILGTDDLHDVELELQRYFDRRDAPEELFALCWGNDEFRYFESRGETTWYDVVLVRGDECEMRTFDGVDPKRFVRRRIAPAQLAKFREALQKEKYESLANYSSDDILRDGSRTQTIGAARYMFIHMTESKGRRLYIHNPPHSLEEEPADNPGWPHRRLIDAFEAMASETEGETIYNLDRPIDGLKVVYANGSKDAIAIKHRGDEIVVTLANSWYHASGIEYRVVSGGQVGHPTSAPEVKNESAWIEALDLSPYQITTDGRFVMGNLSITGELACYDTREMTRVELPAEAPRLAKPLAYLDAHLGFLLAEFPIEHYGERSHMNSHDEKNFRVFKPSLGKMFEIKELLGRDAWNYDLSVWLFDPPANLQVVDESNPDVFWMARPERNGSLIGRYDSRNLRWRDEEWIPHLEIASRDICVSTSEKLAYVLHKGHLLALPLPEQSR